MSFQSTSGWLTIPQVVEMYNLEYHYVWELCATGRIAPTKREGNRWMIDPLFTILPPRKPWAVKGKPPKKYKKKLKVIGGRIRVPVMFNTKAIVNNGWRRARKPNIKLSYSALKARKEKGG